MERIRWTHTALPRAAGWLCLAVTCMALAGGCGKSSTIEAPQLTFVAGRVVESAQPDQGVAGATVRAVGQDRAATTDSVGLYRLEVSAADSTLVQLVISKAGYASQVTSVAVRRGATATVPNVQLTAGSSGGGGGGDATGPASNIVVVSVAPQRIGVRHSGDVETALLTFEVRDSKSSPVDLAQRALVRFQLTETLPDSVFLGADTVRTDAKGRVAVTVNAGIRAQVVQVRASVEGTAIYSTPVPVAVHGGPPDAAHYSIAAERLNVPGLVFYGVVDPITAFTGDRYGNPVPEGTENYFTTTGGIIVGSAPTNDHGLSTVDLVTAAPAPEGGLASVTCQTVDESGARISRSMTVMFSGHTTLSVSPGTFSVAADQSQEFSVTVRDAENGNPLTGGTQIAVLATLGTLAGDVSVTLPDTQDRVGWTSFTFVLQNPSGGAPTLVGPHGIKVQLRPSSVKVEGFEEWAAAQGSGRGLAGPEETQVFKPAAVRVSVTSPNGNAARTVFGSVEK
ncbi:MAG: carboxypeptidase regulatory-like domain-containing protein [Candidatus Eisenbacteria bacterium]|nr:carboxypeptidase regulatory-like domain-containing protein [Candidatus Eisenbacteria bacterium]